MKKKWLWTGLGILIVAGLINQYWYEPRQKERAAQENKEQFASLESSVATLIDRAKNKFPSTKFENDNYCYYQGRKFEPDNLACAVSYRIELGDAEPVDIYDFLVEQKDIVGESVVRTVSETSFRGSLLLLEGIYCNLNKNLGSSQEDAYELDCIADAEEELYELR